MTRFTNLLLRLLRKLLSLAFVRRSIKRLLLLFGFIQRRFSGSNNNEDPPSTPFLQRNLCIDFPISNTICPSSQPPLRAADPNFLHVPSEFDDQCMTPIHSPTPGKGYVAYPPLQNPHSSEDVPNFPHKAQTDTISISSYHSDGLLSTSLISLPLSHHGEVLSSARPVSRNSQRSTARNSQRPNSRNSQQIKVSRIPSVTPPLNIASPAGVIALPDGSRPTSPQQVRILLPILSASVQRWDRNIVVPTDISCCLVRPLEFDFCEAELPPGWISYTHPEGARYFFYPAKKIYTNADLCDPKNLLIITQVEDQIWGELETQAQNKGIRLPDDVELVLEVIPHEDQVICGYYFVNHRRRCLFWLEEFDVSDMSYQVKAVVSESHLGYGIESQYWIHWELFPNNRVVTEEHLHEFRDVILHAAGDTLTSRTSTAVFSAEQNMVFLTLLNEIKTTPGSGDGAACLIGRIMRHISHYRFIHLYGQKGARLDHDQSIYPSTVTPRPILMKILILFLFWAPDIHLQSLEKIWVDGLLHRRPWVEFVKRLETDYQEFSLMATVLLSANMSFLSIQSVDNDGTRVINRSAAQISSYISIVSSLGTIILALLISRQNRSKEVILEEAASLMKKMWHDSRGLEALAIFYALPYALLMWSALTFFGAFAFTCFRYSSPATRFPVGSVLLAVLVLIGWCVGTAWMKEHNTGRRVLSAWRANLWESCKSTFSRAKGEAEAQGGQKSVQSSIHVGHSPISDSRPEDKYQWSLPRLFLRKPTAELPSNMNELRSV